MSYIYLGKYFHRAGKELNLSEKKIGKTINLNQREHELGRTNSPIGYTYIGAWNTGGSTDHIERQIHALLEDERMNNTEWFEDENDTLYERLCKFMKYGNFLEVDLGKDDDDNVNKVRKQEKDKKIDLELRRNIHWLEGETFSLSRPKWNNTLTVTIKNGKFYCHENDTTYDNLHQSVTKPLDKMLADQFDEETIKKGRSVNAWYESKNEKGESVQSRLNSKQKEIRSLLKKYLQGQTFSREIEGQEISIRIENDKFICENNQKEYEGNWHNVWCQASDDVLPSGRKNTNSGMDVWYKPINENNKSVQELLNLKYNETLGFEIGEKI